MNVGLQPRFIHSALLCSRLFLLPFTLSLCAFVTLLLCYSRLNFLSPFLLFSFLRSPQLVALVFLCSIFPAGKLTGVVFTKFISMFTNPAS